jgi:DNA-binding NarL/FixJ family response regulator
MSDPEIQAVVVEDHFALRKGLELLLRDDGIRVIGVAGTVSAGVRMITDRRPDVAIVDLALEGGGGPKLASAVLARDPYARILFYTGAPDRALLRAAFDCGARGFALKAERPEELLAAVRAVAVGDEYVDPRVAELLERSEPTPARTLTAREREIIDLLADGLKGDEIAERLVLSPETVQTHVRNAMRKLGARTRVHLLALAIRLREIDFV